MEEKERINEMIEIIMKVARGDYSVQVELSDKNDDLDSLAMGINMMIDDIRNVIAKHKRAEQELQDSEERLKLLFEYAPDGIYLIDLKGVFLDGNRVAERLVGAKSENLIGKNFAKLNLLSPKELPKALENLAKNVLGQPTGPDEFILHRFDGSQIPVEISTYPVNIKGKTMVLGIARDITERKRAEEEKEKLAYDLNERMKEFRCLYSITNSIRMEKSLEELLVDTTQYIEEAWQYPEVARSKIRFNGEEYKRKEFQETKYKQATDIVVNGTMRGAVEVYYLKEMPESDEGPFSKEERKLLDEIANYLGMYTERIEMEEERIAMEKRLNQAQRLKAVGQLSAGIAHEINTPLQYLGDNLQFLEDANNKMADLLKNQGRATLAQEGIMISPGDREASEGHIGTNDVDYLMEEIPSAIRQSLEGVDYISKIVRAMKNFAQPGVEGTTAIDINEAIESTVEVSRNEWKSVAELEMDLTPDLPLVQCLPSDINQALLAVLLNAAQAIDDSISDQATDKKGNISISTYRDGDEVEIRIEDTGMGIPEDARPHVFEPFFTTRDVGHGSGQGLTMAYSIIVEGHGGSINFETEEGKGTTFIIRLPILP